MSSHGAADGADCPPSGSHWTANGGCGGDDGDGDDCADGRLAECAAMVAAAVLRRAVGRAAVEAGRVLPASIPGRRPLPGGVARLAVAPMMEWTDRHYRVLARMLTRHTELYVAPPPGIAKLRRALLTLHTARTR